MGLRGPRGRIGPPGTAGDQGLAGAPGGMANAGALGPPVDARTARFIFRAADYKLLTYILLIQGARIDSGKSIVGTYRVSVRGDGAGNAVPVGGLVQMGSPSLDTGANSMAAATITRTVVPEQPGDLCVVCEGPNGTTCRWTCQLLESTECSLV